MATKQITIDLMVYRIIQMHRENSETDNDVLQRILPLEKRSNPKQPDPITKPTLTNIQAENSQPQQADWVIRSPEHKKDADAGGKETANGFLVLKDSKVSKNITKSMPKYYRIPREKLFADKVIDPTTRRFTRDYEFTSRSAASSVILGVSSDGNRDWIPNIRTPTFELDLTDTIFDS